MSPKLFRWPSSVKRDSAPPPLLKAMKSDNTLCEKLPTPFWKATQYTNFLESYDHLKV